MGPVSTHNVSDPDASFTPCGTETRSGLGGGGSEDCMSVCGNGTCGHNLAPNWKGLV